MAHMCYDVVNMDLEHARYIPTVEKKDTEYKINCDEGKKWYYDYHTQILNYYCNFTAKI
jgi:hypothetical protein